MRADLICVGNELLTGLIENSNSGFLSRRLWSAGITVRESCVIADDRYAIGTALTAAMEASDLIILTGGLGPTDDDLTREAVADILGLSLVLNQQWLDKLEHFFFKHGVIMPVNNRKQAFVIEGSILLENKRGTAPGLLVEKDSKLIVLLPGPPHELQMMFDEAVLPILIRRNQGNLTKVKTLKCFGIGESILEEKIKEIKNWDLPAISYVARGFEVDLQIKGSGDPAAVNDSIERAENRLKAVLGSYIFGCDDDTLANLVAEIFISRKMTLALAESCSGGLLSDLITDIPGSSKFYRGGLIAYSREAKISLLHIKRELLEREGEVSETTARLMAEEARTLFNADVGIGITGIAGPESDSSQSPVGLVYIAISLSDGCDCRKLIIKGGRRTIKERSVQTALNMLRIKLTSGQEELNGNSKAD